MAVSNSCLGPNMEDEGQFKVVEYYSVLFQDNNISITQYSDAWVLRGPLEVDLSSRGHQKSKG